MATREELLEMLRAADADAEAGKPGAVEDAVKLAEALNAIPRETSSASVSPQAVLPGGEQDGAIKRLFKLGASGIARGAMQAGNMLSAADPGRALDFQTAGVKDNPAEIAGEIDKFGTQPDKNSVGERYLNSAAEAVGGSAAFPVGGLGPSVGYGALSGVAGQAAAEAGGEEARVAGALAGPLVAAPFVSRIGTFLGNKYDLAREILKNVDPKATRQAFREARESNIPINLGQASGDPRVQALTDSLVESGVAPVTQRTIAAQPGAVVRGLETQTQRLGGDVVPLRSAENAAQADATNEINNFRARMSRLFGRQVRGEQNNLVPLDEFRVIRDELDQLATREPATRELVLDVRQMLNDPNIQTVGQLQSQLDAMIARAGSPDAMNRGVADRVVNLVRGTLIGARDNSAMRTAPSYLRAREKYGEQGRAADALNKSVVGRVAAGGAEDNAESTGNRLMTILQKGSDPAATSSEINTLSKRLRPETFRNGVVTYLSNRVKNSTVREGETIKPETIERVNKALFGNDLQRTGIRDMLTGVARGWGRPEPELAYRGFETLMRTVSRVARQPSGTGEIGQRVGEVAAGSSAATLARVIYPGNIARWLDRFYRNNTFKQLDELMNSERGLEQLEALARHPEGSQAFNAALAGILANESTDGNPSRFNKE